MVLVLLAGSLEQPLTSADRAFIRKEQAGLLEWQRALQHFAPTPAVPEALARALPIVSLSLGGQLPLASATELFAEPWHAAQVAAALGGSAPSELLQICVRISNARRLRRGRAAQQP